MPKRSGSGRIPRIEARRVVARDLRCTRRRPPDPRDARSARREGDVLHPRTSGRTSPRSGGGDRDPSRGHEIATTATRTYPHGASAWAGRGPSSWRELRFCARSDRRLKAIARRPGISVSTPRSCCKRTAFATRRTHGRSPTVPTRGVLAGGGSRSICARRCGAPMVRRVCDQQDLDLEEVRAVWEGEFRGPNRLGGARVLTMHSQVIGRPHRLEPLESMLGFVRRHSDVWSATCGEIARRVR